MQDYIDNLIKNYLAGGMSDLEKADFEQKIREDELLAVRVELALLERMYARFAREEALRDKLNKWEGEYQTMQKNLVLQDRLEEAEDDHLIEAAKKEMEQVEHLYGKFAEEEVLRGKMNKWEEEYLEGQKLRVGFFYRYGKILAQSAAIFLVVFCSYWVMKDIYMPDPGKSSGANIPSSVHNNPSDSGSMSKKFQGTSNNVSSKVEGASSSNKKAESRNPLPFYTDSNTLRLAFESYKSEIGYLNHDKTWREYLLQEDYQSAWKELEPVLKDTNRTIANDPLAFYFAALLKLYWREDLNVDAYAILHDMQFEWLQQSIHSFKVEDLKKHRDEAVKRRKK